MPISRFFIVLLLVTSCFSTDQPATKTKMLDPGSLSFTNPSGLRPDHVKLDVQIDFIEKTISGTAVWQLPKDRPVELQWDLGDLQINEVSVQSGNKFRKADFQLLTAEGIAGKGIAINIPEDGEAIKFDFESVVFSNALTWIDKERTSGGILPMVVTNGKYGFSYPWFPTPDFPSVRFTYEANIQVSPEYMVLMSASNVTSRNAEGKFHFGQQTPVNYRQVFMAAGDFVFDRINREDGYYSEPAIADDVLVAFDRCGSFIKQGEQLWGNYPWPRHDILVVPDIFPFEMASYPYLTLVPESTLDYRKNQVDLVARGFIFQWIDQLFPAVDWEMAQMEEGLAVFWGRKWADLFVPGISGKMEVNGYMSWKEYVKNMEKENVFSPACSARFAGLAIIEKWAAWFVLLTQEYGMEEFEKGINLLSEKRLKKYSGIAELLDSLHEQFSDNGGSMPALWDNNPELPENFTGFPTDSFYRAYSLLAVLDNKKLQDFNGFRFLTDQEHLYFIRCLPVDLDVRTMKMIDYSGSLSETINTEVRSAWFDLCIRNGYSYNNLDKIENFLVSTGRCERVLPVYHAFADRYMFDEGNRIFKLAMNSYCTFCRERIQQILTYKRE